LTADSPFREETDDPLVADRRNFFKVELWTKDGQHIERLLFAGNSLDKARALFGAYAKRRPRARLTIRQRSGWWLSGPSPRQRERPRIGGLEGGRTGDCPMRGTAKS
jgi:hypothetical protein